MCGISGIINHPQAAELIGRMTLAQQHRGPDHTAHFSDASRMMALGHNRLKIIDLSDMANQPMKSADGRFIIVYNGEVYNYEELRSELKAEYPFSTRSDTEVILAAYIKWGVSCLERFIGMFAFAIWDTREQKLFCARDRFGVKPFHYWFNGASLFFASEVKALFDVGLQPVCNQEIWNDYIINGIYDHTSSTFWKGIEKLPAGCYMEFDREHTLKISKWYSIEEHIISDERSESAVLDELLYLLEDSVRLRFRSDVPVGICLSAGMDSTLLLGLVQRVKGTDFPIHAFTFTTGDKRYDELDAVQELVRNTSCMHHECRLNLAEIPSLAKEISRAMDEPFGGIPTLAMSKVFENSAALGIKVLMDGNGMDEAMAGYGYYTQPEKMGLNKGPVQGASMHVELSDLLNDDQAALQPAPFRTASRKDPFIQMRIDDMLYKKIPRAMRFADRNSMHYSLELREPFLDHRIMELGLSLPKAYLISNGKGKYILRKLAEKILPESITNAPKRAVQTPQREWLADELREWILQEFKNAPAFFYQLFNRKKVEAVYEDYCRNKPDNSFHIWQLLNLIILIRQNNL